MVTGFGVQGLLARMSVGAATQLPDPQLGLLSRKENTASSPAGRDAPSRTVSVRRPVWSAPNSPKMEASRRPMGKELTVDRGVARGSSVMVPPCEVER